MATEVYATIDGIIKHRHGGAKGWHSAHIKHKDEGLHDRENAAEPKFREDMTDELKARYYEALAGKSFEYLWSPGREARRAERVAKGGPEWIHHGRRKDVASAIAEAEEIVAEPMPEILEAALG